MINLVSSCSHLLAWPSSQVMLEICVTKIAKLGTSFRHHQVWWCTTTPLSHGHIHDCLLMNCQW